MPMIELIYRTTDMLKWGVGKGSALVAAEIDDNFYRVAVAIAALQDDPVQPLQIESIEAVGNNMVITMSDLSTVFTIPMPQAAFRWQDEWLPDTDYLQYDFLTVQEDGADDGLYLVLQEHTSGASFDPEASTLAGPVYQLIMPFANAYDFGFFFPGQPGTGIAANSPMFAHAPTRDIHLPVDLVGSVAYLEVGPDAPLSFPIYLNDEEVGSIDFDTDATEGTFTFAAARQLRPQDFDRLKVLRPDTVDDGARELIVTFKARLGGLSDS